MDSRGQSNGRAGREGDEKNPITAKKSSTYKTDRQCTYNVNIEARSCNRITYSECVFVALDT